MKRVKYEDLTPVVAGVEMAHVFFLPKFEHVTNLLRPHIINKDKGFTSSGSIARLKDLINTTITKYYPAWVMSDEYRYFHQVWNSPDSSHSYADNASIDLDWMQKVFGQVHDAFTAINTFEGLQGRNRSYHERSERKPDGVLFVECESAEESLIAIARLTVDFEDGDPDPYQTAGGYRSWLAPKGTLAKVYLTPQNEVRMVFESHCQVDHYNNNFAGNSTGGGTTTYKMGERVEKRSVTLRVGDLMSWGGYTKKTEFRHQIVKMDVNKALKLAKAHLGYPVEEQVPA